MRSCSPGCYDHISPTDTVLDIVNHRAFQGFVQLMLPGDDDTYSYDTPLSRIGSLMPYHSHVDPKTVVDALNH